MDAWRSPRGVLNDHSEDQFLNLLRRLSSPDRPPDLGDQLPVQTESGPVPTPHGFGRGHNEGLLPSGPERWREGGYVIDFKVGQSFGEPQLEFLLAQANNSSACQLSLQ